MYSYILVPIALDHTGREAPAMNAARQLLDKDGTVTFLHVLEEIPSYASTFIPKDVLDQRQVEAETQLSLMVNQMGGGANAVVEWGTASSSILDFAQDNKVDCIVIASHRPGLQDYFLGSTAARVVRHATCPVHVLR